MQYISLVISTAEILRGKTKVTGKCDSFHVNTSHSAFGDVLPGLYNKAFKKAILNMAARQTATGKMAILSLCFFGVCGIIAGKRSDGKIRKNGDREVIPYVWRKTRFKAFGKKCGKAGK